MKKVFIIFICSLSFFLVSCTKTTEENKNTTKNDENTSSIEQSTTNEKIYIDAIYNIESAYLDSEDITTDYQIFKLTFSNDGTLETIISKDGLLRKRDSLYEINGSIITEYYQNQEYKYLIFNDTLVTTIEEFGDEIEVTS